MSTERNKTIEKEQFNVRINKGLKISAVTLAARLNWSNEAIAELAFKTLLGSTDRVVTEQRKLAQRVAKELNLTFDQPEAMLGLAA